MIIDILKDIAFTILGGLVMLILFIVIVFVIDIIRIYVNKRKNRK